MKRKQIYLTETLERELNLQSKRENKPQAQVVREILEEGLQRKERKIPAGEFLLRMASHAGKGPKDLSKNLDRYLYGNKSPNYGYLYRKKKNSR